MSQHLLNLDKIKSHTTKNGNFWEVYPKDFPILTDITCFILELFDSSMRLPHWHPNANELGYLISGKLEIYMWKYTGAATIYTISPGMCWFIPMGALHSLNNISNETSLMVIGFSNSNAQNVDLPVAFNGIPAPVRTAYTSPHSHLRNWKGPSIDPFLGDLPIKYKRDQDRNLDSPYRINLDQVSPLYNGTNGSVIWAIEENWNILENAGISVMRIRLKSKTARDPIWYPDAVTLYVVTKGTAKFTLTLPNVEPETFVANESSYIFVPLGILHTFVNESDNDFEVLAFFNKANPQPEVSLAMATQFFPPELRLYALTRYAGSTDPHMSPKLLDELKKDADSILYDIKKIETTPYIISISDVEARKKYKLFY